MDKKCIYCGKQEATEKIINPNDFEEESFWDVCHDCKEVIRQQQKLSFSVAFQNVQNDYTKKFGEKLEKEATEKLMEISQRIKQPIMCACITSKGVVTSIELTGEKDETQ